MAPPPSRRSPAIGRARKSGLLVAEKPKRKAISKLDKLAAKGKGGGAKLKGASEASKASKKATVDLSTFPPVEEVKPLHLTFDAWLLQNLTAKQRSAVTKEFREKANKVGNSLLALAAAKKELVETDAKVAQLEETYGRTMKIQDVWRYQERAGLAAIIGQDPQAVMNAPHHFKDEERLMFMSVFPRPGVVPEGKTVVQETRSNSPRKEPPLTRTRMQMMKTRDERLSTDDED
ncbi:hypothetical protein BV898_03165 [Hypsibius exemplaris]|uniref:Uncharacterized protein n=1 Tax=Hypsibius exemplaris TaxID=2072580 RepID=A0A1W0X5F3_HYPEX|nr:hypothetical protein BV898_03165 [Hypsibius exemplaris]